MSVDDTLKARDSVHGNWPDQSLFAVTLKRLLRTSKKWSELTPGQQESLDMIAVKVSRIVTGNPNHADSWHDIAGYARLVEKELNKDSSAQSAG